MNATIFSAPAGATSTLNLPATLVGGTYPNIVAKYGLAGNPSSGAELGTLALLFGNSGVGGNALAITSATQPVIVYRTLAANYEWGASGFDSNAYNEGIPGVFSEASAIDVMVMTGSIAGATNASPIVVQTTAAHGLPVGDVINFTFASIGGNTAANGSFWCDVTDATHLSLRGSTGNGSYTSGGTWQSNKTAGWLRLIHTTDYEGATTFGAYPIFQHEVDGALAINDRIGFGCINIDADGKTLHLGLGGKMPTVFAHASVRMDSGQSIFLNTNQTGVGNAAILFANGSGVYSSSGEDIGLVVATNSAFTNTSITSGSTTATVSTASGITSGMSVIGPGIAPGTTITISGTTVTLSIAAIATNAAASLSFYNPASALLAGSGGVTLPLGATATNLTVTSAGGTAIKIIGGGAPGTTWRELVAPQFGFGQDNWLEFNQVVSGTRVTSLTMKGLGQINLAGCPTSSAGLVTGDIWSNLGILTIV